MILRFIGEIYSWIVPHTSNMYKEPYINFTMFNNDSCSSLEGGHYPVDSYWESSITNTLKTPFRGAHELRTR